MWQELCGIFEARSAGISSCVQSKKRQLDSSNVFGTASKYFLPTRPFLNEAKFRSGHLGSCSKGGLRTVVRMEGRRDFRNGYI